MQKSPPARGLCLPTWAPCPLPNRSKVQGSRHPAHGPTSPLRIQEVTSASPTMPLLICITILPQVTALAKGSDVGLLVASPHGGKLVAFLCFFRVLPDTPFSCLHGTCEIYRGSCSCLTFDLFSPCSWSCSLHGYPLPLAWSCRWLDELAGIFICCCENGLDEKNNRVPCLTCCAIY